MPTHVGLSESELRLKFFDLIFQQNRAYVCIFTKDPHKPRVGVEQRFFFWPDEFRLLEDFILTSKRDKDVYFCVNMLAEAERSKKNCLRTDLVWADLDNVDPISIEPPPPIIIESSPNRFQAIWRLTMPVEAFIAENYSKRIAYKYRADKSGWDLTQLLRVPFTQNFKYLPPADVKLVATAEVKAPPLLFETLPKVEQNNDEDFEEVDVPNVGNLPKEEQIIYKYAAQLRNVDFASLYTLELKGSDDWSRPLWKLIHVCLEAGMDENEAYVIARSSNINKYVRDQRPEHHLWREILKAKRAHDSLTIVASSFKPLVMPQIIDQDYVPEESFVTKYREWAEEATDAVPHFHDLSAFILLASVVSNSVVCKTSYGPMIPNIWGLILGDSTLTRKTTAMRMVMDILESMDRDIIIATDGSAEGLLSGLETRPNRTSIFFRDEVSGFFDAINRKDYLAGMPETFTALYDVPPFYQRRLRKEVIRLERPIFIFFGGGVKDKVYEVLTEEYVVSGFLPRFLVVSGETDLSRLRRTGPENNLGVAKRAGLVAHVADLYENYAAEVTIHIGGEKTTQPPRIEAELTDKAWDTYGTIEELMVETASNSSVQLLALPTFDRLSRSILKMSTILAASRQIPGDDNKIKVTDTDVKDAAWYAQQWGTYSVDLILNTGKGVNERLLDKILTVIRRNPGILRSTLMQHYHLTKREADDILSTLEDRMLVERERRGRGWSYKAVI